MSIQHCPGCEIPNGEHLFRYCNPRIFPDDQTDIPTAIYIDEELSCDWEFYMKNPFTSFHISEGCTKVIEITVCDEIKNIRNPKRTGQIVPDWKQDIIYDPISEEQDTRHGANIAHTLIKGKKKAAVCNSLKEHSREVFREDYE